MAEDKLVVTMLTWLDARIKIAEEELRQATKARMLAMLHSVTPEEEFLLETGEDQLLKARAKVVREALGFTEKFINEVSKRYGKELALSAKGHIYPLVWMIKDAEILAVTQKYPIVDMLNYIDRITLHPSNPTAKRLIGDFPPYATEKGKEHQYAVFLADERFYKELKDKLGKSRIYVQKLMAAFTEMGILKKLKRVGQQYLYADGYHTEWHQGKQTPKKRFLNQKKHKVVLRGFQPDW